MNRIDERKISTVHFTKNGVCICLTCNAYVSNLRHDSAYDLFMIKKIQSHCPHSTNRSDFDNDVLSMVMKQMHVNEVS